VVGPVHGIPRDPLRVGRRVGRRVELIPTGFGVAPKVADGKLQRNSGQEGARRRRGWSVTRPHTTQRGFGTPRDPSRQRKGSPWSETRHDGDGEQLGTRSKAEGFGDEARVASTSEVVCAHVPESERAHWLVRCSRASVERMLLTTGFRPGQAERRLGSAHTRECVHRTRARRAKATAWSSACMSVRPWDEAPGRAWRRDGKRLGAARAPRRRDWGVRGGVAARLRGCACT
jgi:hypothetical protein